jgi:hypothetical protein
MNQKIKDVDLTIVVNTCDAYHDVLKIFFYALQEYWPELPYPVVINAESNAYSYSAQVHNFHSGTGVDDWGSRVRSTLASIDTEFVMMLYDDFILDRHVDGQRVQAALNLLKSQPNAAVTYLTNTSLPIVSISGESQFIPLRKKINYRLNSAPAIWRKQALMAYTAAGDTPWAWEVFGTYRTWADERVFYALNPLKSDIYFYNYSKGGAIYRGRWVREVVDKVSQKYPLDIDWSKKGFSSDTVFEKRSLMWKIRFMQKGFSMVGYKAIYFIFLYIWNKLNASK